MIEHSLHSRTYYASSAGFNCGSIFCCRGCCCFGLPRRVVEKFGRGKTWVLLHMHFTHVKYGSSGWGNEHGDHFVASSSVVTSSHSQVSLSRLQYRQNRALQKRTGTMSAKPTKVIEAMRNILYFSSKHKCSINFQLPCLPGTQNVDEVTIHPPINNPSHYHLPLHPADGKPPQPLSPKRHTHSKHAQLTLPPSVHECHFSGGTEFFLSMACTSPTLTHTPTPTS